MGGCGVSGKFDDNYADADNACGDGDGNDNGDDAINLHVPWRTIFI